MKRIPGIKLLFAVMLPVLIITGCGTKGYETPAGVETYSASGTVVDESGNAMSGVTVNFTGGSKFKSVTTGSDGTWSKSDLYGSVTVTPSLSGYTFTATSQTITEAATDLKFTGALAPVTPSGQIINRGVEANGAAVGSGVPNVALTYQYPSGTSHTIYTDSSGKWTMDASIKGSFSIKVTPSLDGWIFIPSSFTVTYDTSTAINGNNIIATSKYYTGADLVKAITNDTKLRVSPSQSSTTTMPDTETVSGETVPIEGMLYMMAKFVTLYTDGSKRAGTVPSKVPYLYMAPPTSNTFAVTPKYDGTVFFGGTTWGYYYMCTTLVSTLESSFVLPNEMQVVDGYNISGDPHSPKTASVYVSAADAINCLARDIYYTVANSALSNIFLPRRVKKPSNWP